MTLRNRLVDKRAALAVLSILSLGLALALPPTASADTLDNIKKSGKMTVGTEAAFPPFEFVQNGKIVGYGKDILDVIVADLGVQLEQLDLPYQGIFPGLLASKFDFIATALMISDTDAKRVAFTMPIAEGSSSILKRKGDARINKVDDLNGKVVGAQLGTPSERLLRDMSAKYKAEGKPGFELKLFTSGPEGFLALANSQIDAVVSLLPTLKALAVKQPNTYEVVGRVFDKQDYIAWATRSDDKPLRDYLSSRIKALRDSGKLYAMQDKWFGFRMEVPDSSIPAGGN
jgi:polar amino acid transport system substrate-binding protein